MHVAITGASSGIGEAIAREYARAGAKLTLVARRRDLLDKIAKETGARCHVVTKDLSDHETAADWLDGAEAALGPIDVLVNNAGIEVIGRIEELEIEQGEKLLSVNLLTPLRLTRAILPSMLARRSGTIVDVASVAGLCATNGYSWYGASKAGLAMASETLRAEVAPAGVHVVTVYPGPVHSDMANRAMEALEPDPMTRLAPWGRADELARLVRRAVEKKKARVIYPRFYTITRWFPPLARFIADRAAPRPKSVKAAAAPGAPPGAAPAPAAAPTPARVEAAR